MFRRLVNNNYKAIGIRRLSDNTIKYNYELLGELKEINRSLNYMYFNTLSINILVAMNLLIH
jgi:hypothetical protein